MHILSIPCIAMASINFYVGGYYFYFYIKRSKIKENLPFALLCISVALYDLFSAGLYNSLSIRDGVLWQRLQLNTVIAISIFLILFISAFTEQNNNRIIQLSVAWFICIFIISLFTEPGLTLSENNPAIKNLFLFNQLSIVYYEGTVGLIYQIEIISSILAYIYLCYLILRYYEKTKYKILLIILTCQIFYFIGVINDSLVATQVISFIYISEYTFFFIILSMAYALLDRFVNLHIAYEELNINLEQKIVERTSEISKLNNDLKHLAERDGLTGIYNRRFFNEYLEIEMKRASSHIQYKPQLISKQGNEMNFGVALIDIDHFKKVNDTYGHLEGDNILRQVTDIMERNIFHRDVLCRYGGDEFALIFTRTSSEGILQAMEKIRKEIDEKVFIIGNNQTNEHITISGGLANYDEVLNRGSAEIVKLADDRLYKAKSLGRNKIIYKEDE